MKFLLTTSIRIYWQIWPAKYKRPCLFRESCSHHVFRTAAEKGLIAGIQAFLRRFKVCRKGYAVIPLQAGIGVRLIDGSVITSDEVSPALLKPIQIAVSEFERR